MGLSLAILNKLLYNIKVKATLLFFNSSKNQDINNKLFLLYGSTIKLPLSAWHQAIYFALISKVYMLYRLSWTTLLSYYQDLLNNIWHTYTDATSHQTLSSYVLPMKNKLNIIYIWLPCFLALTKLDYRARENYLF
jgi:hypothetical protein